ncbi:MAG: glycoside hydrolase family 44 protein [Chloroflexi bacterium]|nr:glycoside hydrolase family 44 protein [Chloroflexota bacterium]
MLSIDVGVNRHAISPYIYGMNFADENLAAELRMPVRRWGGNSTTRYNWQTNTHNTGNDWYFENILADVSADQFIDQDRRTNTKTILTMPLIGWTAKQGRTNHPFDCGFRVSRYGAQQNIDPWDSDCGNGKYPNGSNITTNDPLDTSAAITPTFVANWIQHLVANYGTAANGGVMFYNLDNEPMLWNSTHRDVHPAPTSYDEMRDRTYQYAAAIKATDPTAKTLGPVLWGWSAYFESALDDDTNGADRAAHNNTPFLDWYLQQMRAYEQQQDTRILDYLDIHFYPQANGVALASAGDANTQALRLRSTRALWDPTYADESWIAQTEFGPYVRLIPRMRDWVNNNYPGTKLAITEYNWGALDHINGALAQADVLGILGRESVNLATLWGPPSSTQPGAYAFRIYRNYDGAGKAFGDVSVGASSTDQARLAIYAAQRSSDNALTLMIINKTTSALTTTVTLNGFAPSSSVAQVYRYDATNLNAIVRQSDQPVTVGGFSATFPTNSITLFVIPGSNTPTYPLYLPLIKR